MTAANFAAAARQAPNPSTALHVGAMAPGYVCHMAAMHWAFVDLGDTQAVA